MQNLIFDSNNPEKEKLTENSWHIYSRLDYSNENNCNSALKTPKYLYPILMKRINAFQEYTKARMGEERIRAHRAIINIYRDYLKSLKAL